MKSVAIICSGYTGLTAAYRLSQQGFQVTIFEKSSEVGGLTGSFKIQGTNLEKAYHHLFKTDKDIIRLTRELGINHKLKWYESSTAIYYEGEIYAFMTPYDLLKFSPLSFWDRLRTGLIALYFQRTEIWKQFTHISAVGWMKKWTGKKAYQSIWEPLLKSKFDTHYDKISMVWLGARISTRGNSKHFGQPKEILGYFDNGFHTFTQSLIKKLNENNVQIITNANVKAIKPKHGKVRLDTNDSKEIFDQVIATVPSHVFSRLIEGYVSNNYTEQLNSVEYLGSVIMIFSSEQDIGQYYWNNIHDIKIPFLVFINHTKLINKKCYNNKYIYYIGTYISHHHESFSRADEELSQLWFACLEKIFPEFDESQVIDKHIFRFKNAQHIVDLDYENKIPDYKTPVENVFLANFSQIFPEDRGTNYAVREGERIAQLLISESEI